VVELRSCGEMSAACKKHLEGKDLISCLNINPSIKPKLHTNGYAAMGVDQEAMKIFAYVT